MGATILQGDCRVILPTLAAGSIHCVVTSPPYFGLRDYGTATWEGGNPLCNHLKVQDGERAVATSTLAGGQRTTGHQQEGYKATCGRCGAVRVDRQIGLEVSPVEYVQAMVEVFRHVWRVLRDDGTVFLNLGDSYANTSGLMDPYRRTSSGKLMPPQGLAPAVEGIRPKNLLGIPWHVAFALQDDGWILRSDIIWHKPNPMPESVQDRPTRSHEYIFLLAKQERYFYDAAAIAERAMSEQGALRFSNRNAAARNLNVSGGSGNEAKPPCEQPARPAVRNRRTVWTVATQPFAGAHFATFPSALIEPCISAGTSAHGCCPKCSAPWKRSVEKESRPNISDNRGKHDGSVYRTVSGGVWNDARTRIIHGWEPTCKCGRDDVVPCVALDPFAGAGTVPLVAASSGRNAIGIELNPEYCDMARNRLGLLLDEGTERKEAVS